MCLLSRRLRYFCDTATLKDTTALRRYLDSGDNDRVSALLFPRFLRRIQIIGCSKPRIQRNRASLPSRLLPDRLIEYHSLLVTRAKSTEEKRRKKEREQPFHRNCATGPSIGAAEILGSLAQITSCQGSNYTVMVERPQSHTLFSDSAFNLWSARSLKNAAR